MQVTFNFRDLAKEKIDVDTESISVVIKRKDVVIENLKVEKFTSTKKEFNYYIEIPKANVKELGEYQIELTVKNPSEILFTRKFRLG